MCTRAQDSIQMILNTPGKIHLKGTAMVSDQMPFLLQSMVYSSPYTKRLDIDEYNLSFSK